MKRMMVAMMVLIIATNVYSMEKIESPKNHPLPPEITMASLTSMVNHLYHHGKTYQESQNIEYQQPNVHDQYFVHLAVDYGKLACSSKLALLDYQKEKLQRITEMYKAIHMRDSTQKKDTQLHEAVSYFSLQGPHTHMDHPKVCINIKTPNRLKTYTDRRRCLSPCTTGTINQAEGTIHVQTIMGIDDGFNILEQYVQKQYHTIEEHNIAQSYAKQH